MITSDFKMDLINKSTSVLYSGPCDCLVLVLQLPSLKKWKDSDSSDFDFVKLNFSIFTTCGS